MDVIIILLNINSLVGRVCRNEFEPFLGEYSPISTPLCETIIDCTIARGPSSEPTNTIQIKAPPLPAGGIRKFLTTQRFLPKSIETTSSFLYTVPVYCLKQIFNPNDLSFLRGLNPLSWKIVILSFRW